MHNIVQALLDIMFLTLTFHAFLSSADFLKIFFFIISIIISECQTVQILIGPDDFVGPDLGQNRHQVSCQFPATVFL